MGTTRLLCLHGCHGSGEILRRQIAPLAAGLSAHIDLVFVDAPSLSSGDFGWWHEGLRGWERTREWAIELFSSQHFDGIFGFSQGAALAGMLAAVREAESAPLPFDLAIMVGGFTSTLPQHAHLFEGKLSIPSLHIMGRRDSRCAIPCSWPSASPTRSSSSTAAGTSSRATWRSRPGSPHSWHTMPRSPAPE